MKLHQARAYYRDEFPFAPWLFAICRNALIDHVRREEHLTRTKEKLRREESTAEFPTEARNVSGLAPLLNQLPPQQKAAVEMRYLAELPFEAIARELSKSEMNIRQMVSRGLKRLRALAKKTKQ